MRIFSKTLFFVLAFATLAKGEETMSKVMQIDVIPSKTRGITQTNWLESYHTFSFGNYRNLKRLNFGTLRVFNEDIIKPKQGFPTHHHDNMEIITIILDGALTHKDSTGHHSTIKAGEVQHMSAGSGIEHSEYNASATDDVHLLQIWVYPKTRDLTPSYDQKAIAPENFKNTLFPIVSQTPSETSLPIQQNATFYRGDFDSQRIVNHKPSGKYQGNYLFVIEGQIVFGDQLLGKGDSALITSAEEIEMKTLEPSKLLLIEVNMNGVL